MACMLVYSAVLDDTFSNVKGKCKFNDSRAKKDALSVGDAVQH